MRTTENDIKSYSLRLVRQAGWYLFSILFFCCIRVAAASFSTSVPVVTGRLYPLQPEPVDGFEDISAMDFSGTSHRMGLWQLQNDPVCPGGGTRRQNTGEAIDYPDKNGQCPAWGSGGALLNTGFRDDGRYTNILLTACLGVRDGPDPDGAEQ